MLTDLKKTIQGQSPLDPTQQNMYTPRLTIKEQENYYLWRSTCTKGMQHHIKGHMPITWINSLDPSISIGPLSHKSPPISIDIYHENMNFKSLSDYLHPTYISKFTSSMFHSIGLLHMNIQCRMPQLQHYSFGCQILNHMYLAMQLINWVN